MTTPDDLRKEKEDECRSMARMLGDSVAGIRQLDLQELDTLYGLLRQACISLGWVP